MYEFEFHRPNSVRKAASLGSDGEAKFLAGGQTLLPTMKQRLAAPESLIDLSGIDALRGIELRGRTLHIGAMTRHGEIAESATVKEAIPSLAQLASLLGDPHVRAMGTMGGSLANNDPAADYPAACLALSATIVTNKRRIAAEEFFTGMFETALEDGEIITKVLFPVPRRAAYSKFRNPASRYALVGVFVAKRGGEVRVAVTGAGPCVFRAKELEEALTRRFATKSLDGVTISADGLSSDIHASAEYRAHLVTVMARRAVADA
ncbi:FAD binding domain-containing protein [Tepidamorphus sp. 3E244]|uniref:FAD binding domain-containing protein n=1 Tax=Tepidamorphus sp. 3E244 TaxID=3385498 RepID=UPI0038FC9B5C